MNISPYNKLKVDTLVRQNITQSQNSATDTGRIIMVEAWQNMRRTGENPCAISHSDPRHSEGSSGIRGTVITARQNMGMQVYH
ncbi:hypothetical protein GCM10016234_01770 [Tianweitania populi]|uniref:Uncharacterized protein n=1 Tax=Tianweitania populi TaxID=1607949 RepID=A0A8J3GJ81_9HYPH|nr:hypothetical protein GCM10016234_01770 [Tianweitania populi]